MRTAGDGHRAVIADIAWVTVSILLAIAVLADMVESGFGSPAYRTVAIAAATAAVASLFWRRTKPVHVAILLFPLVAFTELAAGPALAIVYTVAALRDRRTALIVAASQIIAPIAITVMRTESTTGILANNFVGTVIVGSAFAWGTVVKTRRQLVESLRERAERAEAQASLEAEQARWQERERIAREMHDVVAHRISLISLHAGALEVGAGRSEATAAVATTIRTAAHDALEDLRDILGVLRSDGEATRPEDGLAGLAELVDDARSAGAVVTTSVCDLDGLDAATSRTAYRIVQEAMTNARKHAPGEAVDLAIDRDGDTLVVVVRNPVTGDEVTSAPGSRSGLIGVTERVRLAGGTVVHGIRTAERDREFAVSVRLPWTRSGR